MLTDDLRRRIERLRQEMAASAPSPSTARQSAGPVQVTRSCHSARELPPGLVVETSRGSHWTIRTPLAAKWRGADEGLETGTTGSGAARSVRDGEDLALLSQAAPGGLLFLDLETCGLGCAPIFLAGAIYHDGQRLVLEQLLARTYEEEGALLESLWRLAAARQVLVTFNGKSFDWPLVRDRRAVHQLDWSTRRAVADATPPVAPTVPMMREPAHVDLLHMARRRWKGRLPNCRLQTLETYLCRRRRSGDIPGAEIPAVYHHYVRTGDSRRMAQVLEHNALDLVTLAQLTGLVLRMPAESAAA